MTTPVEPVQARPPTTGLLASAAPVTNPNARWENGFSWRPERCITHQGYGPCDDLTGLLPDEPETDVVYYFPPGYRVRDYCTSIGGELDTERLRRQVEAITSFVAARELWTGELSQASPYLWDGAPYVNPYLANGNATVVTGPAGVTDPAALIGALESEARLAAKGQQVFLHIPEEYAIQMDTLRRSGNLLLTPLDSVVVPDAGYPGTGPMVAGTSEVQEVTLTGAPTGGTFTLSYDGQTTTAITFDAAPGAVQSALEALSNLEAGDVAVTGTPGDWTVTFSAELGDVAEMTGDGSGLTGGTTPDVAVTTTTPGVAPAPTPGVWAYATGPVQVRTSSVEILDNPSQSLDRTDNRWEIWGSRLFAATFDPCIHLAIELAE